MSYETMDHAAWAERNNAAMRVGTKPKKDADGYPRGPHAAPEKLTPFQARVMDICGIVGGGIYNAPIAWEGVYWSWGGPGVAVPWGRGGSFATFDHNCLTMLVLLCHQARIRVEVRVHGRGWLLCFHQRSHEGSTVQRHPDIAEAVAAFREYLPDGHRVTYLAERDDPMPAWRRRRLESLARGPYWLATVSDLMNQGKRTLAEGYADRADEDVDTARRLARELGGGPELDALVQRVVEHAATTRAAIPAEGSVA